MISYSINKTKMKAQSMVTAFILKASFIILAVIGFTGLTTCYAQSVVG